MICVIPAWLYFRTKFLAKIGKKIRTARLSPFYPVLIKKSVYYYWENKDNFEGVGGGEGGGQWSQQIFEWIFFTLPN